MPIFKTSFLRYYTSHFFTIILYKLVLPSGCVVQPDYGCKCSYMMVTLLLVYSLYFIAIGYLEISSSIE